MFCSSVALKFGCSKSVLWTSVHRVVDAMLTMNVEHHIIQWPSPHDAAKVISDFTSKSSFPGFFINYLHSSSTGRILHFWL